MNQKKLFRSPLHIEIGRRQFLGWMAALGASVGTGATLWLKGQGSVLTATDTTSNIAVNGKARFTVLTPTLIRMEFANDGQFDDNSTFNVVHRNLPAPKYTTRTTGGWFQIQTANLLLEYQVDSGAFNADNLKVHLRVGDQNSIASPFELFAYSTLCEAESGNLSSNVSIAMDHLGYTGSGFVVYTGQEAIATWSVTSVPSTKNATLHIKYANAAGGDGQYTMRTLSLYVNGTKTNQLSFPTTANWDTWAEIEHVVMLKQGTNTISLAYDPGDSGNINLDSFSITPMGSSAAVSTNLGGWRRSVDLLDKQQPMFDGLLDRRGWYMLDDSATALFDTSSNTLQKRSNHNGQYQDGYFFGYGHDYQTGLRDFIKITGTPPLLPRWAFGIWSSRYYPYTASDLQTLVGQYRNNHVPLDFLMIDTDFKAPNSWNGWEWNAKYFPDPEGFMKWTQSQRLNIGLNIHPSITVGDPQFAPTNATAKGLILSNGQYVWDWSNAAHIASYFALHQSFDKQGVRVWWLDYCCDDSRTSLPGITTDTWINCLYAQHINALEKRGFAFSRIGSLFKGGSGQIDIIGQSGIWAEHRYTVHFTGDSYPTWDMLQWQTEFTTQEGNVGIPYVSHDLGSFHGSRLDDAMYMRWIQFGTFQPIFRIHSDHGYRYPWDYPNVQGPAEQFFRLREALIPFTYSLAYQATTTGLPITRSMYLYYPQDNEAYMYRNQYFMGESMLVAPVITPGANAASSVWFPSGTWTNFFNGRAYVGPAIKSVTAYYDTMPVFVKPGGIIPLQPYMNYASEQAVDPLTLKVYTGQNGSFVLYEDEGDNHNYKNGNFTQTSISYDEASNTLTIAARQGSYAGALTSRGYVINFANIVSLPAGVTVNGQKLNAVNPSSGEGWWYSSTSHTLSLQLKPRATSETISVKISLGGTVLQAENAMLGGGAGSNTNQTGFSGKSFIDNLRGGGASAAFTLQATQAGNYAVILRYANGNTTTQALSLYVNGTRVRQIILPSTADWNTWANAVEYAALSAGKNIITYKYDVGDSGNVNLDRVTIAYINAVQSGSTYKIMNRKTGKVLAVSGAGITDGTSVQIATDNSTKAQQWTITDRGQGIYNLINASSGKALAVSQAATTDGANVQIYTNNGTDAQGWYITDVNGNIYLGNIGSGSALNVSNNGINTNIWSYNGKEEQQWHLTKT